MCLKFFYFPKMSKMVLDFDKGRKKKNVEFLFILAFKKKFNEDIPPLAQASKMFNFFLG